MFRRECRLQQARDDLEFVNTREFTNYQDAQFWRGTDGEGATMNRMIDAANTDKVKPLREFVVKSTQDYTTSGNGKEHSYFRELYVPLNNKKIQYSIERMAVNAPVSQI